MVVDSIALGYVPMIYKLKRRIWTLEDEIRYIRNNLKLVTIVTDFFFISRL